MIEMNQPSLALIDRIQQRSMIVGAVLIALSLIGIFINPAQFFRSYLLAYVFWTGIALGCLAITLLHHLSGGRWGAVVRRFLESSTRTFPLLALLFLPILAGMHNLYEWSDQKHVMADEILKHKSIYLNVPFFTIRAVIYFLVWIGLARILNKWSIREDEKDDPQLQSKFQWIGGIGLLLYGLTVTFAAVDWMMSLEPHWFSTMYGLLVITGQVLSAFAFVIAVASVMAKYKPLSDIIQPLQFHDLGNLLLAFVMIWAYLAFSQFLIIWSGNLPEEIPWYMHRIHHGWQAIALLLVLFHFALPFLLLLSRKMKRDPRFLAIIAIGVLVMRFVDLYWLVAPEFHTKGFGIHWLDLVLPVGIGGIWLWFYLRQLKNLPLIPMNDPNIKEMLENAR